MTATNHDDQLGEIYPTMLNGRNCTFGVSYIRQVNGVKLADILFSFLCVCVCVSVCAQ